MIEVNNIYKELPDASEAEVFQQLLSYHPVKIERIVSKGQSSPNDFWYDQEWGEWVILLQGKAELEFESGGIVPLTAGDYLYIPPHKKHRVKSTAANMESIWLAVLIIPE